MHGVVAGCYIHVALESLKARSFGHDTNGARIGVFTVECPLRALQDFDPLNVCQVGHSEAAPAQKYTIHEHAHRGLKRRV